MAVNNCFLGSAEDFSRLDQGLLILNIPSAPIGMVNLIGLLRGAVLASRDTNFHKGKMVLHFRI